MHPREQNSDAHALLSQFILPPTLETAHTWADTIAVSTDTFGKGVWVRNENGIYAHRKPGVNSQGSVEALREIVCTVIAGWLHVPTPRMELIEHPVLGPCSLSYEPPEGGIFRWYNVMEMKLTHDLYANGVLALEAYAGRAVVLDILVGACDRRNSGNHLYVESDRTWYTIDYGLSFNRHPERDGVGDPSIGYGLRPYQEVWPDIVQAIRLGVLRETLSIASELTDTAIEGLLALPPEAFGDGETRGAMISFLKYRRSHIRDLVWDWCKMVGVSGVGQ